MAKSFLTFISVICVFLFIIMMMSSSNFALGCELPSCCNSTMRNTINPTSKFPYCFKVGVLADQGASARYITREIPLALWNYTILENNFMLTTNLDGTAVSAAELETAMQNNRMLIFQNDTNLGYDGGLESLRNSQYDMFLSDVWALSRRAPDVDFSVAYTREWIGLVFAVKDDANEIKSPFLALFAPLTAEVWGLAVVLMFIGAILLFVVEMLDPTSDDIPPNGGRLVYSFAIARSVLRCCDGAFFAPFGAGRFAPTTSAGVMIIFGLKFCFLIIIESYLAQFSSFLTVQGAAAKISLDDLMGSRVLAPGGGNAAVDIAIGAGAKTVFLNENSGALPTPDDLRRFYASGNEQEIESYVTGSALLLDTVDRDCGTRFLQLPVTEVGTVLSFRQNGAPARVRRAIDTMILTLKHNSTMSNLFDSAYLPVAQRCPDSRFSNYERVVDPESLQLGPSNMRGLFVITISLMVVAILAALILRYVCEKLYGSPSPEEAWKNTRERTVMIDEDDNGTHRRKLGLEGRNNKRLSARFSVTNILPSAKSSQNPLLPPTTASETPEDDAYTTTTDDDDLEVEQVFEVD